MSVTDSINLVMYFKALRLISFCCLVFIMDSHFQSIKHFQIVKTILVGIEYKF